jgi:hypothetical protein
VWEQLRGEFTTWYENDPTHPVTTLGVPCYSAAGKAASEGATVLGIADRIDDLGRLGVTQLRFDFGANKRSQQINQGLARAARVVMQAGDPTGDMGTIGAGRQCGTFSNPRSLGTLSETFTLYVWAIDKTAPRDYLAQFIATRDLLNEVHAALYRYTRASGAGGKPIFTKLKWVATASPERLFGQEIEAIGAIESVLPDTDDSSETITGVETDIHQRFRRQLPLPELSP